MQRIMARQRCPPVQANKHKRVNNGKEDRISLLPDEVLVSILSLLTLKEAAQTSALARRWLKVWTFYPTLNFDASQTLSSLEESGGVGVEGERLKYVEWVNSVLDAYQGSCVDEFSVKFDLDAMHRSDIDRWLHFASEKNARRLVVNFRNYCGLNRLKNVYAFPSVCKALKRLRGANFGFPNFKSLTVLKLKSVTISGAVIEYFIATCPSLQSLTVKDSTSQDLVNLNVSGQSLCLKELSIFQCSYLNSIRLSATNLLSFKYLGRMIDITFANVPSLVAVSFGGGYSCYVIYNFPRLSNYVFLVETLALKVDLHQLKGDMESLKFPVLARLKNLRLNVVASEEVDSLLIFAPLIKAAPSLYRLVLELNWLGGEHNMIWWKRNAQKGPKSPLQSLKVVELLGFVGHTVDMEFAKYLIRNAVMLGKIVIDPMLPIFAGWPPFDEDSKRIKESRKRALRLQSKFSLGDKLVLRNFGI